MLQLKINGDGRTASLVRPDGVAVADGEIRPVQGAEFIINETSDGAEVDFALRFVGKVVPNAE